MVIARTSKAAARIFAQFKDRSIKKIYTALVLGAPPVNVDFAAHRLVRDGNFTRLARRDEEGVLAKIEYRLLETGFMEAGLLGRRTASRLSVKLITGFKHQIRSQLSILSLPVVGDVLYGVPRGPEGEEGIGLFASELSLKHPISGEMMEFSADPGDFWPWNLYQAPELVKVG
jgi:23S rRNA pseudouridine1911/1915/1917 synthase